jgi:replicative DNA helicase
MKFDKIFEEEILSQALKDVDYIKKASRILDSHHFVSPQHGWLWKTIKDVWLKYKEVATPRLILTKAKVEIKNDEDRFVYIELVTKLLKKKVKIASASLDELQKFTRIVDAQIALEEAAKELEKGHVDKVFDTFRGVIRKDIQPKNYTLINWMDEFDQRQEERKYKKEHPDEFICIPTGWSKLDRVVGGLQHGELGLVIGTTGMGKSSSMSNMAFKSTVHKFKSVIFALEMPARQIAMRQDSRWLKIPYKQFKNYDFTNKELDEIRIRRDRVQKQWSGLMKIISMPIRSCNMNIIQSCLDDLYEEDGFKPDVIFVDSGDHMKPVGRHESFRHGAAEVYWGLKDLAEEGGYAIWSSVQAGREWANKIATAEATSESYDKARIADLVLSINSVDSKSRTTKTIDDFGEDVEDEDISALAKGVPMELFVAKYRDGDSKFSIPLDARFDRMLMEELEEAGE